MALPGIRDALLLLSLVARVDADAWRHVLKTYCGLRVSHWDEVAMDSDGFSSPQFIFKLEELAFRDNITRVSQVLADFLLPVSTVAMTHHLTGLLE